jgi:hypothetical protein
MRCMGSGFRLELRGICSLSPGFTPQGVPRLDACCVPLTPLSTRSSL